MDLKRLSNQELDRSFKSYAKKEREVLKDVLLHTAEVDRRKMYLDFGFSSLFEYMTQELQYANGCAQRRIDAARLSHDVPGLIETIESGEMNLSKIALVQTAIRQTISELHVPVSAKVKSEVVAELIGKSTKESQIIVAQAFGVQIKEFTKVQHQADESVRLEVTLSKEQWSKLEEMRALLSHSLPSGSWDQVLEYVADKVIQQKNKNLKKSETKINAAMTIPQEILSIGKSPDHFEKFETNNAYGAKEGNSKSYRRSRMHIPTATLRELYKKQDCCQFKGKDLNRKCGSKWQLQTDHIKPIWAGGDNSLGNLQRLCGKHNRRRYEVQAGIQRG